MWAYQMPVMQPMPIQTKNKPWWHRAWLWATGRRRWRVVEDWHYQLKSGLVAVIPAGFVFDAASIPRVFWWFLSPTGLLLVPSLIHDHAYRYGFIWILGKHDYMPFGIRCMRGEWDRLFREMSDDVNGVHLAGWIAWVGVRLGGWMAWGKCRKRKFKPIDMRVVKKR